MLPFVAPLLAKPIVSRALGLPWLKICAAAGALAVALAIWFHIHGLNRELHAMTVRYETQVRYAAKLESGLEDVTRDRDMWVGRVTEQNRAITMMQVKAREEQEAAIRTAVRRLQLGQAAADLLRQPTSQVPPGADAMNQWQAEFAASFGGR